MARRILSRSLLKFPSFFSVPRRLRSSRSGTVIVIDLDPAVPSTSSTVNQDYECLGVRKIEAALHKFFVLKATPDWLPFVPGQSFWVPQLDSSGDVAELAGKIANPLSHDLANKVSLSEEETLWITHGRGCRPSRDFFTQKDDAFATPVELEEEVKVTKEENSEFKDTKE